MDKHNRWRKKQHKILWKLIGKRKARRIFKDISKTYTNQTNNKIMYYKYLD